MTTSFETAAAARGEVANLLACYAELLDDGDFDALGRLFADGTVTITGGPADGRSASGRHDAGDLYRSILIVEPSTGRPGTRHLITNIRIEFDTSTRATARSYFCVLQQTPSFPLQPVATGTYDDRIEYIDGRWAFRTRRIVCDQVGDLSAHMNPA